MTGAELKAHRVALGWSAPLAGSVVGYSAAAIYAIEAGNSGSSRLHDALVWAYRKGNNINQWPVAPDGLTALWRRRDRIVK
jgi:hypothetical protein